MFSLIKQALYQGMGRVLLLTQQHDLASVIFGWQLGELAQTFGERFR